MANYKLTVKAEHDLAEIYEYGLLHFGRGLADVYLLELQKKINIYR